jgi:flagella synthesis protein FlgN
VVGEASEFIANLLVESRTFDEFVELLKTEQETLQSGDVDRLVSLAQLKTDKVITLAKLEDQRNRKLTAAGVKPDQRGMDTWLKQHTADFPEAEKIWAELLSKARHAQELNKANGIMIEQKLRHNQQALAILQAAANHASTYGPDGQTLAGKRSGRPLGKV